MRSEFVFQAVLAVAVAGGGARAATLPYTTGLTLWLEADKGLAIDGATWQDQSPNGFLVQAVGATATSSGGPIVTPNKYGKKPAVYFDGTRAMKVNGQPITGQAFTIVAVVSDTTAVGGNTGYREVISNWDDPNAGQSVFLGTTGINPVRLRFTDDIGGASDPLHTQTGVGSVATPGSVFLLAAYTTAKNAYVGTGISATLSWNAKGSKLGTRVFGPAFYIGRQGTAYSNEFWKGNIEEVMVYNKTLTAAQLHQDLLYLKGKYGVGLIR